MRGRIDLVHLVVVELAGIAGRPGAGAALGEELDIGLRLDEHHGSLAGIIRTVARQGCQVARGGDVGAPHPLTLTRIVRDRPHAVPDDERVERDHRRAHRTLRGRLADVVIVEVVAVGSTVSRSSGIGSDLCASSAGSSPSEGLARFALGSSGCGIGGRGARRRMPSDGNDLEKRRLWLVPKGSLTC